MSDFIPYGNNSPYPTKTNKWEDNYKRATFYIEKEILRQLEYAVQNEKGKKTEIINKALQRYLGIKPKKNK
jgi:metal-responsive CopG/Arc/MetJ family transcriptional regulator